MHFGFILSFPQFLIYGLIHVLIFEVSYFYASFGTLGASVHHDGRHIWVGESRQCLGNYGWLTAIALHCAQILFQLLHYPDKLVRGSWYKIKDIAFYVTALTLEVGIEFKFRTLGLGLCLLSPIPLRLGCLSLDFSVDPFNKFPSGKWDGLLLITPLPFLKSYVDFASCVP